MAAGSRVTPEYDVVIVGGGGSGLAAALSAAEHGGRVLVVEKCRRLGGTTGIAVGSFTASGTSLQEKAGIADDVAAHAEDAARFAPPEIEAANNEELRRFFLSEAAATFEWLRGLGLSFFGPSPEPPNRVPRMHNVVPGAKAYIARLHAALLLRGGEVWCGTAARGLLREDGRVVGIRALRDGAEIEVRARRGVVLAAGDYASGADLIARHKGPRFADIEGINPDASGDGHRLAAEAGAALVNMEITYGPELRFVPSSRRPFQQLLPAGPWASRILCAISRRMPERVLTALLKRLLVTWQHPEDALFEDGAILVNQQGERFADERARPERELAVASQPGKVCYILLGGRLIERYSRWPHFISTAPDIAYAYVDDYRRLRPDVTACGETLDAVGSSRGLDVDQLHATVSEFNDGLPSGTIDPGPMRAARHPLHGPWALLGPAKAYFTTTEGGAAVNRRLEVLDPHGKPIPGLYAAGQNGLGGMVLWGHGLHIAWALTSGRLAGRTIMEG